MGEAEDIYTLSQEVIDELYQDQSLRLLRQNEAEKENFNLLTVFC